MASAAPSQAWSPFPPLSSVFGGLLRPIAPPRDPESSRVGRLAQWSDFLRLSVGMPGRDPGKPRRGTKIADPRPPTLRRWLRIGEVKARDEGGTHRRWVPRRTERYAAGRTRSATQRSPILSRRLPDEPGGEYQRHDTHQLDQDVHRRPRGVLERIAHGVADDGRLVGVGALAAHGTTLDV